MFDVPCIAMNPPVLPPFLPFYRAMVLATPSRLALCSAPPADWFNPDTNATALWRSAGELGLRDMLYAQRAAEIRAKGGLLS